MYIWRLWTIIKWPVSLSRLRLPSVCVGGGGSSFPPTDEKGITAVSSAQEAAVSSISVLAHSEETAQWPFLTISSLFSLIEPDSLSFLERASDTIGTW